MFLGWGGQWEGTLQEGRFTLTPSASHPIPARLSPFLAAHTPQSLAHTSPCPGGGALSFPQARGTGWEAHPATWPEVLRCLPVCSREGDREETGHHHVPSHSCPLLLTSVPRPGDRAKLTLLQKSSCPPCILPPSTSCAPGPGRWPLRLSSRQLLCVHTEILSNGLQISLENNNSS